MQYFNNYLESKRIVPKKQVPYYVVWISQFFNFFNKKPTDNFTSEEIDQFLEYLTKRKEEWQVDQASESIRIYQFFKSLKNQPETIKNKDSDTKKRYRVLNCARLLHNVNFFTIAEIFKSEDYR